MTEVVDVSLISGLITEYNDLVLEGKTSSFTEADVGSKFILPLIEALGWNTRSIDEVQEQKRTLTGPVDYSLNIDGKPKLVLEIKKFQEDLDGKRTVRGRDESFPHQATRYAWHLKVDWCILTNFRELRLYYAHTKNPEDGLIFKIKYNHFVDEGLNNLLLISRENVLTGKLDTLEKRRTRNDVDVEILDDLFESRELLGKSILKNNPELELEVINDCIQKILDRIVVIRVAEDRGVIGSDTLWNALSSWKNRQLPTPFMRSLKNIFREFDDGYNSKLFEPHPCEDIKIDNDVLQYILSQDALYGYNFDLIDADVLGAIYEDYIGHILSESKNGIQFLEDSGVRRERGIYYTPTFIVNYIVRNILEEKLKNCTTPEEISKIKVLDPACGSGSFLIKAFDVFEEWYKNYNRKEFEKTNNKNWENISQIPDYKNRIITDNLFGVDLDAQAAEIASVNLMLKALTRDQKLPKILGTNIKIGNSLVSGDEDKISKFSINCNEKIFNWEDEFPEVFSEGGFDVVIGNPPYINAIQLSKIISKNVKKLWKKDFCSAKGAYDIYIIFIERGLTLLKKGGILGYITPNKYLSSPYGKALRGYISKKYKILEIVDVSRRKVFKDPSVYPILSFVQKNDPSDEYDIMIKKSYEKSLFDAQESYLPSKYLTFFPENIWGPILSDNIDILHKIYSKSEYLQSISCVGATSTAKESDEYTPLINEEKGIAIVKTGTIDRYVTTWGIKTWVSKGKKMLCPKLDMSSDIINDRRKDMYLSPKIIIAKIALRLEGFLDHNGKFASINTNCIHSLKNTDGIYYLTAFINSKLISFVYAELFNPLRMSGGYFQYQAPQLRVLPVYPLTINKQKKYKKNVETYIKLNNELNDIVIEFSRYWPPLEDEFLLKHYYDELEVKDQKIMKILAKGKLRNIYVDALGEWIILKADYESTTDKKRTYHEKVPILKFKIDDEYFRQYLTLVIQEIKKKFKKGNISNQILSINIPRFDKKDDENKKIIKNFMIKYNDEMEKRENLIKMIDELDTIIDEAIYDLYDLTTNDITRLENTIVDYFN